MNMASNNKQSMSTGSKIQVCLIPLFTVGPTVDFGFYEELIKAS